MKNEEGKMVPSSHLFCLRAEPEYKVEGGDDIEDDISPSSFLC